jgi:RNA polymerase sigma factor (sigma-70 family)
MKFESKKERDKFIIKNLPLVSHTIKKSSFNYNDDIFQEGVEALIRAVNYFDETKNVQFSTYAIKAIYMHIKKYNAKNTVIRSSLVRQKDGKSIYEYADTISINETFKESENCSLEDIISDNKENENLDILLHSLKEFYESLTDEKERKILIMLINGSKQKQIAKAIGFQQGSVSRRIKKLKLKIKENLGDISYG